MTSDEKMAIQSILLDELADRQKDAPTLLIDALLSNQGHQWVWRVLSTRYAKAAGTQQAMEQLLRAVRGPEPVEGEAA
jgi:hypothetical protein